ncbi:uncharacterized protein VTP21DRAFT_8167 [Calcarisporiella thermophila]|uniref:uncharacterized protein n=1 Tax=Calcarisporiella thermophila TaxID=911321 RepID=UPI0037448AD1
MTIKLYDLVAVKGDTTTPLSPFCFRIKCILKLKGLKYEVIPLTFLEIKEVIPTVCETDSPTVPVIVDGDVVVSDSYKIAQYLEEKYPEPSIFHGTPAIHRAFDHYTLINFHMNFYKLSAAKIPKILDKENGEYFAESRKKYFGPIEELEKRHDEFIPDLERNIPIFREMLQESGKFLSGDKVGYADIVLAGWFFTFRRVNPEDFERHVVRKDDPILSNWFERMLELL